MRRSILLLAVLLICSVPARGERGRPLERLFIPATQPAAPVETLSAADLPLDRQGADEQTRKRLQAFDRPPRSFDYTLQLLAEEEQFRIYRLVFPSPLETPWPQNNIVPAEYYVPRTASGSAKVPAAVVLDILDGSAILPRMMARSAAQNGLAALYVPMPCYNARRPPNDEHEQMLRDDPARAADGLRQTVMDVRRAKAILASRPEVDASHIGITGISLGGIMTALSAGVDGTFARAVPILAGGNLADITFHCHEMRKLRAALLEKGIGREAARDVFAPVEPLTFAGRIGADRCLMINATKDEVIPKATTVALHEAAGKPRIVWLPGTHYPALGHFPVMQKTVIEFLRDGTRPQTAK